MSIDRLHRALTATRVLAILRAPSAQYFVPTAQALAAAGVQALEFTLTSEGTLDALTELRAVEPDLLAGVGTVITPQDAVNAVAAGAQFLVAPCVRSDTLAEARRLDVPMIAGALTPTEVVTAHAQGAAIVKLFPASLGPAYVKALRDPLPNIDLVVTGGVALSAIQSFLDAGAFAVGLGSPLTGDALVTGDTDTIVERARIALANAAR
jgi:2-dehydro-3-deoxyphosphogluconate aldolase/(4S)-4-hydroxy-2-oxoglutarate aldolase